MECFVSLLDRNKIDMARKIAAGNWKMNNYIVECVDFMNILSKKRIPKGVEVILAVPYTLLGVSSTMTKDSKISISAQNCHQHEKGAYTGEISPSMVKRTGAEYVIIGHSERREYNSEGNSLLLKKIKAALEADLKVIFCCGESLEIRKDKKHKAHVTKQIKKTLFKLSKEQLENIVIAYEPIWAIGTGETATPKQAQKMHKHIRGIMEDEFGAETAENTSILYGGSVKPANAEELFSQEDVDGGLVGGASLDANSFYQIIKSF